MTTTELSAGLLPVIDGVEVLNVATLLRLQAQRFPNQILLKCDGQAFTYASIDNISTNLARGFAQAGVVASDKVCLLLPNCPEVILVWMALAKLGAVMVPVNSEYKGSALTRMIESTGCRLVVVHEEYRDELEGSLAAVSGLELIWVGDRAESSGDVRQLDPTRRCLDDLNLPTGDTVLNEVGPGEPLMFLFTSGSTGMAKPVSISHGFAMHTAGELIAHAGYCSDDVMYTPFPLFHADATMLSVLPAIMTGTTVVVARRFSASGFLHDIREHGATVMTAMGTVITYLLNQPERPDDADSTLRLAIGGAVPATTPEFERRFGLKFIEVYGSTECCLVSFNISQPHKVGLCGRVCEHHDVRIVDEHERPLRAGEVGQIVTRSLVPHGHMSGYHGSPEATVAAWQNLWYHTGDLGFFDAEGTLRFSGRTKDVIRRRGENIPAAEVEQIFNSHPAVLISAAIAVPSDIVEDDLKVVVESVSGMHIDHEELINFARSQLPQHMVPRYLEVVELLPRTPTGKTNKVALREQWATPGTSDFGGRGRTEVMASGPRA